jgi:hypothetical protein
MLNVELQSFKPRLLLTHMHPNTTRYKGIQHERLIELTIYYYNFFPGGFSVPFPAHPCNSAIPSMHQAIFTHANRKLENTHVLHANIASEKKYKHSRLSSLSTSSLLL